MYIINKMKELYKAQKESLIILNMYNNIETNSIVYLNNEEYDNVILAEGKSNTRVLEIDLKEGDILSIKETKFVTYSIEVK